MADPLFDAMVEADSVKVAKLISEGANPNAVDEDGESVQSSPAPFTVEIRALLDSSSMPARFQAKEPFLAPLTLTISHASACCWRQVQILRKDLPLAFVVTLKLFNSCLRRERYRMA
jgi:hypothetical protein